MASPELGSEYKQLDFPIIVDGNFCGRNFLGMSLLDKRSIVRLDSVAEGMEKFLIERVTPLVLRGEIIASLFDTSIDLTRMAFESAVHRLGGNVICQMLPASDDPQFDYKVLDIAACNPDAIIIDSQQQEVIFRTASILNMIRKPMPVINVHAIEEMIISDFDKPDSRRIKASPHCVALLALVLGKIK